MVMKKGGENCPKWHPCLPYITPPIMQTRTRRYARPGWQRCRSSRRKSRTTRRTSASARICKQRNLSIDYRYIFDLFSAIYIFSFVPYFCLFLKILQLNIFLLESNSNCLLIRKFVKKDCSQIMLQSKLHMRST